MCIIDDSVIFFIMHIQVPGCLCVFLLLFWGRFNEEINLHDWHFFVFVIIFEAISIVYQ